MKGACGVVKKRKRVETRDWQEEGETESVEEDVMKLERRREDKQSQRQEPRWLSG